MFIPVKVAVPATAARVNVPFRVVPTPPALFANASVTLAVEFVRLPNWSRIWTVIAGVIDAPAAVVVGCCAKASLLAAAAVTGIEELVPELIAGDVRSEAVIVWLGPVFRVTLKVRAPPVSAASAGSTGLGSLEVK
jgi:hypothetical protein